MLHDLPPVQRSTRDFCKDWEPFLSMLYKFSKQLKLKKTKLKEYKQCHLRTCFFPPKQTLEWWIDGSKYYLEKKQKDSAGNVVENFVFICN